MQRFKKIILVSLVMMLCGGGMISAAGAEMVKKIVLFHDGVTQEERGQYAQEWDAQGVSTLMDLPFVNGLVLSVPDTITSADLADDYRVASVEDDQKMELQALVAAGEGGAGEGGAGEGGAISFISPVDAPQFSERPWGILKLFEQPYDPWSPLGSFSNNVPSLIKKVLRKKSLKDVRVAIFDTGIDATHSKLDFEAQDGIDLINRFPLNLQVYSDDTRTTYSTVEFIAVSSGRPVDDNGHGTHVAGTIGGVGYGVVDAVHLFAVKVLDENAMGDISTMIMALQWAVDNDIDIVNMSFAFMEDNPAVRVAVQKAHEAGIIMVAAVGNHSNWETTDGVSGEGGAGEGGASADGTSANPYPVMYPAAYPEVIAVGAHDAFGEMAAFSNTGPELDVLAPGTHVVSSNLGDGNYGICSGTSMATPHVSGTVALMLALDPMLTPDDVKNILQQTSLNGNLDLAGALEEVLYRLP